MKKSVGEKSGKSVWVKSARVKSPWSKYYWVNTGMGAKSEGAKLCG